MEKGDKPIKSSISSLLSGKMALPTMQRKHTWTKPKVRDPINSVYKRPPSDSTILLKIVAPPCTRDAAVPPVDTLREHLPLLNGRQRLASLATVMKWMWMETRVHDFIKNAPVKVHVNMDHLDEALEPGYSGVISHRFQLGNCKAESDRRWIPATSLFTMGRGIMCAVHDGAGRGSPCLGCRLRALGGQNHRPRRFARSRQSRAPAQYGLPVV